jgi:hypothetical protein
LCFVSLATEVTKNKGNPLWHDQNQRVVKARPTVTNRLGSGGTPSFEKKYVRFFFSLRFSKLHIYILL